MDVEIAKLLRSIDRQVRRISESLVCDAPAPLDPGRSYTRQQTARLLGVSVWSIDRARRDGQLVPCLKKRDIRTNNRTFHQNFE